MTILNKTRMKTLVAVMALFLGFLFTAPAECLAYDPVEFTGTFLGCGVNQGILGCGIQLDDGTQVYFDDGDTPACVMEPIDPDTWSGRRVKVRGLRDGELVIVLEISRLN